MLAYHGEQTIKDKYIGRVRMHRLADELIRGIGWNGTRGCAVGCTLEKYDHIAYETELGIPRGLARLEDGLFESMPIDLALQWPERFLAAIRPGADLSLVLARWFVWMLIDESDGVLQFAASPKSIKVIKKVAALYQRKIDGGSPTRQEFAAAYAVARKQCRIKQADKLIELLEAA